LSFQITPGALNNPHTAGFISIESGGSTGTPTASAVDVEHLLSATPLHWLRAAAYDLMDATEVIWQGILPASTLTTLMHRARMGQMPARWFSQIGSRDSKHWVKYGLATYYTLGWMRLLGAPVPFPEYVPPARAEVVAQYVQELLSRHGKCRIHTNVSRALRMSLVAQERGWDFRGATFIGGGEPCTNAKVSAIVKCGARFFSAYNLAEAGILACGCAHRIAPDDVHLVKDTFALISHPHPVEGVGITVPAFQLTTILPTAKQILLNLQVDDYGKIEERSCGCMFDECGFTTHLSEIRSYRKLTGEGVTLIGGEMLHILEQVLPARFGGSALDYQMIEEENERGFTQIYLVIHPCVHIADESAVLELVNKTLRETSAMADIARAGWKNADSVKLKRMEPVLTARGKLLPLHLQKAIPQNTNHAGLVREDS
jgi:phenylacetate-coenzyme A ligase PaaK-like adenylate-forming protein